MPCFTLKEIVPTKCDNSIQSILNDLKKGKFVLVCDEVDRENEADLVMAAEFVTNEKVNFMINHGRGLICVPMSQSTAERLELPLMIREHVGTLETAFTVSVDAKFGIGSGISSLDRATTIRLLSNKNSSPQDFHKPGHIFPLIAHVEGLKKRKGHTEAAVELMKLSGLQPVAVLCETLNEEGIPLKGEALIDFAERHYLKITSIVELMKSLYEKSI
jgi:3,4-dihydroxy 2-butanone 4-phosphate synthase/GTP cyclohydrolase II